MTDKFELDETNSQIIVKNESIDYLTLSHLTVPSLLDLDLRNCKHLEISFLQFMDYQDSKVQDYKQMVERLRGIDCVKEYRENRVIPKNLKIDFKIRDNVLHSESMREVINIALELPITHFHMVVGIDFSNKVKKASIIEFTDHLKKCKTIKTLIISRIKRAISMK
jgi:hypothetical protein